LILNPFKGHTVEHRDVKKSENWHVIRKFTQLDGDFVVDNNGIIVTAGRYIDSVSKNIQAQSGLGGRHVSAASITRDTKAVAVTLSKSGAVRVYKDGKMMVEL
jgi:DNA integrity scanning protein DisA with diadenylate cyclase activity